MRIIKFCYLLIACSFFVVLETAANNTLENDTTESIVTKFDKISYRWDAVAADLEQYNGLGVFCLEKTYRNEVFLLLEEVHHFDSLIYEKLVELSQLKNNGEIKKTIKQIEELETEFGIKEFSKFLSKECRERREVEKQKRDLEANLGQEGYAGQQQLVESTLYRYVHHVTYLVDHIRKHIHHLHLEDYE